MMERHQIASNVARDLTDLIKTTAEEVSVDEGYGWCEIRFKRDGEWFTLKLGTPDWPRCA